MPGRCGYSGCVDSQAHELANKTLAEAIDSLMTMGSPFLPIVLVEKNGQRQLQRIVSDRIEEAAAAAREMAASQTDADGSSFAVDGFITYNGTRSDAIVVEAWNFHTNAGVRIGLRYELTGVMRKKKPSLIGSPLELGSDGWFDPEEREAESPAAPEAPVYEAPVYEAPVYDAPVFEEPVIEEPIYEAPVYEVFEAPVYDVPVVEEPVAQAPSFGPPPEPSTLAPADIAPPPPLSAFAAPQLPPEPERDAQFASERNNGITLDPPALPKAFATPATFAPPVPDEVAAPS